MDRYAAWRARAEGITAEGLKRSLRAQIPTGPTTARIGANDYDVFSSNDYLGLAEHPEIRAAMGSGGAGAARLISGNRPEHDALEEALGAWMGRPATLFASGYLANVAVMTTLFGAGDLVASDALNHASIIDGLRLSKCRRAILPHGGTSVPEGTTGIVVEGLYSMDGDAPDFAGMPKGPMWVVDEAHAVGCLGPEGRGLAAAVGFIPDVVVGTLGKAFGAAGAFVIGPPEVRELLVSSARSFIYTTAMPAGVARAATVGLRLATQDRRDRLGSNTTRLREGLRQSGIEAGGVAHIVPIATGARTMEVAQHLFTLGVLVGAVRFPTVPRGQERLRLTVSAAHSHGQIDQLVENLVEVLKIVALATLRPYAGLS